MPLNVEQALCHCSPSKLQFSLSSKNDHVCQAKLLGRSPSGASAEMGAQVGSAGGGHLFACWVPPKPLTSGERSGSLWVGKVTSPWPASRNVLSHSCLSAKGWGEERVSVGCSQRGIPLPVFPGCRLGSSRPGLAPCPAWQRVAGRKVLFLD